MSNKLELLLSVRKVLRSIGRANGMEGGGEGYSSKTLPRGSILSLHILIFIQMVPVSYTSKKQSV